MNCFFFKHRDFKYISRKTRSELSDKQGGERRECSIRQREETLLAQEIEPIVPEAVATDGNPDHPAGMMYSTLIPILIKAFQEQQASVESQRTVLAAQQSQLQAWQKKLSGVDLVNARDGTVETPKAQNRSLEQRIEAIEKLHNLVQL